MRVCANSLVVRELKVMERKKERESDLVDVPSDLDRETENEMNHESSCVCDQSCKAKDEMNHTIDTERSIDHHSIEVGDDSIELPHDFYPIVHSEQCTKASLVPSSLLQVKLLFFFLELYCLGLSVLRASFAKRRTTYQPSSRLLTFFSANKLFLRWGRRGFVTCRRLVAKYSSISKQMVYFANTFTKVFLCTSSSSSTSSHSSSHSFIDTCYTL